MTTNEWVRKKRKEFMNDISIAFFSGLFMSFFAYLLFFA